MGTMFSDVQRSLGKVNGDVCKARATGAGESIVEGQVKGMEQRRLDRSKTRVGKKKCVITGLWLPMLIATKKSTGAGDVVSNAAVITYWMIILCSPWWRVRCHGGLSVVNAASWGGGIGREDAMVGA